MRRRLLARMDEIARRVSTESDALAVIGLGSIGVDRERLDRFSDLDFFVIVEPEAKSRYIDDLSWLEETSPIAFAFRNTIDGHKVLFEDGIYAEFAVFEPQEARHIGAQASRMVWQSDRFDAESLAFLAPPDRQPASEEFLLGELMTNLLVGLMRLARGEKLSAFALIQVHAANRMIELVVALQADQKGLADRFDLTRRVESIEPEIASHLSRYIQGYDPSIQSALAMLDDLERKCAINTSLADAIKQAAHEAATTQCEIASPESGPTNGSPT